MPNALIGNSAVATHLYQAFYGQAPSNALYNAYIADIEANGQSKFAESMAGNFKNTTDAALALQVLNNLGITTTTVTATGEYDKLLQALTDAFAAYPTMRGQVLLNATNLFANLESDATYGAAATTYNKQALANFTYANNSANTTPGTPAIPDPTVGTTFVLTTSPNTFAGTALNDTFNAAAVDSLSAFDSLTGGAGTDTLNANLSNGVLAGAMSVSGIESATIANTNAGFTGDVSGWTGLTSLNLSDSVAGAVTVTAAATTAATIVATGASAVTVNGGGVSANVTTGAGAVDIGKTGAAINAFASITVKGGTTVDISDNKTAAANSGAGTTLKTVSVDGNTGLVTVKATALTALNLANDSAGATVTGNTGALALGLNTVTGGTIADAGATSLAITNSGGASSAVTVQAGAATSVTVATSGKALSLTALTAGLAATVGISGDAAVTITADTFKSTAVITSTNTAGVTLTQALATGQQFVGTSSSGADTLTLGASTTANSTGAGNDSVTFTAAAFGTGGSIAAGDGTDTLTMTAANAATASSTATLGTAFAAAVTGFEKLVLTGGGTNTVDAGRLVFTDISTAGDTALTLNGVTTGTTLRLTGAGTAQTVASTAALLAGTTDVLNVAVTGVTTAGDVNFSATGLTATDVETVAITSDYDSSMSSTNKTAALTGGFANQITVLGNSKTITVGGAAGMNLTATSTTLTTLDASGNTVGATGEFSWTSGALAGAATVKGASAAMNTIDFSAATKAVTYTGGTGADTINFASATTKGHVVDLGNGANAFNGATNAGGADSVTGGTGVDTILTGAGADTIVGGGGADVITAGAGADKITISGTTATIKQVAVNDSGTNSSTTIQTSELTSTFDVVYGVSAGVQLDLTAVVAVGSTTNLAGANLAGANDSISFARGTYDAAAGTFTYAANGADSAVTYDTTTGAGTAYETIILVGYVTGATTGTGLLAFA